MLPPKRELPFPTKKDKPKVPPKEADPQSLSLSLDPLQRKSIPPKVVKQRKSRAKITKPKAPVSSVPIAKVKATEPESQSGPPETSSTPPRAEFSYKPSASKSDILRSDPLNEARIPTSDTLMPSSPPRQGTNEPCTQPVKAAKKTPRKAAEKKKVHEQSPKIFEDAAPDDIMDRLDHWVRKHQDLLVPKQAQDAAENLAAYAAQPEETRLGVIDDMIVECLGDENFIKLVEDVDKSWRRIGLGF